MKKRRTTAYVVGGVLLAAGGYWAWHAWKKKEAAKGARNFTHRGWRVKIRPGGDFRYEWEATAPLEWEGLTKGIGGEASSVKEAQTSARRDIDGVIANEFG